jgi:hypothetical protein
VADVGVSHTEMLAAGLAPATPPPHQGTEGKRALFGSCELFNRDPYWRYLIPFHEYFHGDTGRGCGASHQTGWTGLIAQILIGLGD